MCYSRSVLTGIGLALGLSAAAGGAVADAKDFANPPPNLIFQLQKENRAHPWLRVTVDSARLDFRAERIDQLGLGGLQSRASDLPPPLSITWRSIGRIDEVVTLAARGKTIGLVVGGVIGAGLGNAIGTSMRSHVGAGQGYAGGDLSSTDHGGVGTALGMMLFGGLGAWQGARWGERQVHERSWYVGTPAAAYEEAQSSVSGETRPADSVPDSVITQRPAADVFHGSSHSVRPPSPGVLWACERIGRNDLIRLRCDLGEFKGFAAVVGPEGVEGLGLELGRDRSLKSAIPARLVTWDRIERVDKRGHGWRKGALIGGLIFAPLGGYSGYAIATEGFFEPASSSPLEAAGASVYGIIVGGALGAALGAGVGWVFPAWLHVYLRPEAAGNRR